MESTSPYDIIVQQQIDIVAKCQKEVLDGEENALYKLAKAVQVLGQIRELTKDAVPFIGVGTLGGSGIVRGGRFA